ncbi:MAG: hypothetical protein RR054_05990 [Clostridia bacterium]
MKNLVSDRIDYEQLVPNLPKKDYSKKMWEDKAEIIDDYTANAKYDYITAAIADRYLL